MTDFLTASIVNPGTVRKAVHTYYCFQGVDILEKENEMLKLEFEDEQISQVIDKIVERTMRMDLTWDWPCGVAYYGIATAYEKTGKKEYLDVLKDRVDELIELGVPSVWTVNACAMGHCLITLFKATGEQKY